MRSKSLVIITSQIRHVCPYKGQDVALAMCYRKAPDITDTYCYACDYVPVLKRRFGLRTFRRKITHARCVHCDEALSLHEVDAPHKGTRNTACPGFVPQAQGTDVLWVALDKACTDWMAVDAATGERQTLAEYYRRGGWPPPLIGAPGEVPSDWRDKDREVAAELAARKRAGQEKGNSKLKKQKDKKNDHD